MLYQILELPGARPALPAFGIRRYLFVTYLLIPTDMLIFPLSETGQDRDQDRDNQCSSQLCNKPNFEIRWL